MNWLDYVVALSVGFGAGSIFATILMYRWFRKLLRRD